jgi:choline dehydrogenase-like flavoprotein
VPFVAASAAQDRCSDVTIVGSGAAGGRAAYTLALEGLNVMMVEAGRKDVPELEAPMLRTSAMARCAANRLPTDPLGSCDATIDGRWEVPGEPYASASDDPAHQFYWRGRRCWGVAPITGSHHAQEQSLRFQALLARRVRAGPANRLRERRALLRSSRAPDRRRRLKSLGRDQFHSAAGTFHEVGDPTRGVNPAGAQVAGSVADSPGRRCDWGSWPRRPAGHRCSHEIGCWAIQTFWVGPAGAPALQ